MKRSITLPDCWSDDRRMKVLFSPLRQRNVNPENYDGQVFFWKKLITDYSQTQGNPKITYSGLREAFIRNGEKPHCLQGVLSSMASTGQIMPMEQFLQNSNTGGWRAWSIGLLKKPLQMASKIIRDSLFSSSAFRPVEPSYVVLELVNAQAEEMIRSLKNQIVSKSDVKKRLLEWNISADALHLVLHELECRQKLVVHHLPSDDNQLADEDYMTVFKFGTESHNAYEFTEIELSIHKLHLTEKYLLRVVGHMEKQIHEHEESAKQFLADNKRVLAKNSLRKRDSLLVRIKKRVHCLENVQTLMLRIHEVSEDATVLDAYRTGTKSLRLALDKSGITIDTVHEAIAKMHDVIGLHDEMKGAISTVSGATALDDDADLERELRALVKADVEAEHELGDHRDERDKENDLMNQLENLTIASDPLPPLALDEEKKERNILVAVE